MRTGAPDPFPILALVCSVLCACAPGGKGEGNDTVTDKSEDYPIAGLSAHPSASTEPVRPHRTVQLHPSCVSQIAA